MAQEMERLMGGVSEDEYDDMDGGVKEEEEDEDEDEEEKAMAAAVMATSSSGGVMDIDAARSAGAPAGPGGGARRCRPKEEKERTKLRERQRRAITARILAGLRRHGNYNLRVRADINDVIAALAREAGWVVLPDGTTFPSKSQGTRTDGQPNSASSLLVQVTPPPPLRGAPTHTHFNSVEYRPKSVYVPRSVSTFDGVNSRLLKHKGDRNDNITLLARDMDAMDEKLIMTAQSRMHEREFFGTPYVPVYVMLPLGVINIKCELVDPDGLVKQLKVLKSINVDGVMVNCWWGIVEAHAPQEYNWNGYKKLFQIIRDLNLKVQVIMSFHECGGNVGDDACIPLPHWVAEIGRSNPDIFFTDREGRRNPECLTWGIDKERVLKGRTALEVYFDFMRSFRIELDVLFTDGAISEVEVGLGPCGELRYPSYPVKHGWRYPGIGEFQCYDQYLMKSLRKAAEVRGHTFWARGPDNAGIYNCQPHETGFFCDGGDYNSVYGRFFLNWYSQVLVDHGDHVLSLAKLAFDGTCIVAKFSGISWWYKTASHAAEVTAGFYNPGNRDGYTGIVTMLKKHGVTLNFSCAETQTLSEHEELREAFADPTGLFWQVLYAAWDAGISVTSENTLSCHDRDDYNRILNIVKPMNDPDGRHLHSFTYLRLSPVLMERNNFAEFEQFVKRMHGEGVMDL